MDDRTRAPEPFTAEAAPHDLVPVQEATTDMTEEPQPRLAWHRSGATSVADGPNQFAGTPLYTREKVNPLTMIEQLRKPDTGVPLNLFDDFNGLPPDAQKWEFYEHAGRWQNRLIHGDSSQVMQSLIARDGLAGQVQMIYFDPPYGIGFKSNFMTATDKLETKNDETGIPVGDTAPVRAFRDTYRNGIHSYLDEIHERLMLFRELLAESGSLFLQIGDDNVHLLALACDEAFGSENRVATITWRPTSGGSASMLPELASYLLWYAKDKQEARAKYQQLYEPLTRPETVELMTAYATKVELTDGTTRRLTRAERADLDGLVPKGARIYYQRPLTSMHASLTRTCDYEYEGVTYHPGNTRQWSVSTPAEADDGICGMDRLAELGRLDGSGKGGTLHWKRYEDEIPGRKIDNVWHRPARPRDKRYTVQTDKSIIERCILMSTDPGDLVLDPTCGSGVTAHLAEHWGRRWITIDVGRVAVAVARRHLLTEVHPWYRTLDGGSDPSVGLDVEVMQRVSAGTLAYDTVNDPENTIHLVDRPKEDKKRKRLTGPFTVESASPYTYLPFESEDADTASESGTPGATRTATADGLRAAGGQAEDADAAGPPGTPGAASEQGTAAGAAGEEEVSAASDDPRMRGAAGTTFPARRENERRASDDPRMRGAGGAAGSEDLVAPSGEDVERLVEALLNQPICDSNGGVVLEVAEVVPWPSGRLVTHEADCTAPGRQTRLPAAVMLAPPDATVTAEQIGVAAAEALRGRADIEDLIVVASAFDNNAPHTAGRVKVHKVVTARDLQIAALAEESDSGAFTLLGEPDVRCETRDDGNLVVTVAGYDTYDPAAGNIRSSAGDDVDCWMIDTDHDGTAFFPRLVYLPGYKRGDSNIKNLLKALGKDLDPIAEKALCGLTSQPFPPPTDPAHTVAVKIITRTGAEMTTTLPPPTPS